jgi:hypothetical protein
MALPHFPSRKILSCGIVPVHFDGQRYRLLALRSSSGWDFPKALLTGGRDPQQVAIGAARDVTGLTELEFSWGEDAFRETIASDDGNSIQDCRSRAARSTGCRQTRCRVPLGHARRRRGHPAAAASADTGLGHRAACGGGELTRRPRPISAHRASLDNAC